MTSIWNSFKNKPAKAIAVFEATKASYDRLGRFDHTDIVLEEIKRGIRNSTEAAEITPDLEQKAQDSMAKARQYDIREKRGEENGMADVEMVERVKQLEAQIEKLGAQSQGAQLAMQKQVESVGPKVLRKGMENPGVNAGKWFRETLLNPRDALTGGGDGSGLIPETVTNQIWFALLGRLPIVEAGAPIVQLPNGSYKIPKESTAATAYWLSEGDTITDAATVFGDSNVEAHNVKALLSVSNEMLQDQPEYSEMAVMRSLEDALTRSMNQAFLTGEGSTSDEPEGIFTSTDVTTTDLSSTDLTIDHVIDAYYDVLGKGGNPANMVLLLHPAAARWLEKIRENDGQTSEGGYLASTAAPLYRDLRWIVTNNAPYTDGSPDTGDIIVADVSQAIQIFQFGGFRMNVDSSAAFASDETMFRVVARMDVGIRYPTLVHKLESAQVSS